MVQNNIRVLRGGNVDKNRNSRLFFRELALRFIFCDGGQGIKVGGVVGQATMDIRSGDTLNLGRGLNREARVSAEIEVVAHDTGNF